MHRGELRALLLAAQGSLGPTLYVSDNLAVCEGWWSRHDQRPHGEDGDLWLELARIFRVRPRGEFVVARVNSRMEMAEAVALGVAPWLVIGNAVADVCAGQAAEEMRASAADRAKGSEVERTALLVRRRLLRATLDAIEAEGEQSEKQRRPRRARQPPPCRQGGGGLQLFA